MISLPEVSCIWDFCFRSPDALTLARLSFFGGGLERSALSFSNESLDDEQSDLFSASWGDGRRTISASTGPSAMLLSGPSL